MKGQIIRDPTSSDNVVHVVIGRQPLRVMPLLMALPLNVFETIGRTGFYGAWYLLYFVACAFRTFTGFMLVAAVVMLPMALGVFINPDAAPMPWWFFFLSALGMFAFAVGYYLFLDWVAPPGAEDPFDRYRPKANRRT